MKLNLNIVTKTANSDLWGYDRLAKFNPVGWWKVTTEGDCEGRSTTKLGTHYGHLAEIAFHLRKRSGYSLTFKPETKMPAPGEESKKVPYTVERGFKEKVLAVSVVLDYELCEGEPNPAAVAAWLDADGVTVTRSNYYHAIKLEMKV